MKIKNLKLMLVSAFLMVGSVAFAKIEVGTTVSDDNGNLQFKVTKVFTDPANTYEVEVIKVLKEVTELSIPASFTKNDLDNVTSTFKVVGFANDWAAAAGGKDVSKTLKTLSINAENMATISNAGKDLKALESLTVSTTKWPNDGYINSFLTADTKKTLTTLDLSGMTAVKDLGAYYAVTGEGVLDKLTSVKLPANLETIANEAFKASKITSIELPASLKEIGDQAFEGAALTGLNLNANVNLEKIGNQAFSACEKLAKLQMSGIASGKLKEIGAYAFEKTAITAANIPATVTTLGEGAFENCTKLTQVSAMAGLVAIPKVAFGGCEALTKVTISKKVETIGASAFEGCKALATIAFAERGDTDPKLTSIGDNAFKDCEALTSLDLSADWCDFNVIGASGADNWFVGCKGLKEILLSKNVAGIYKDAFADCAIEELDLSNTNMTGTLQTIFGAHDAENPNALKSILLPEGLTGIKAHVFDYSALTEITLPASLTVEIPAQAFYYCDKLKTVNYMPEAGHTVYINEEAFLGCTPFVKINTNSFYFDDWGYVEPTNATFGATEDLAVTPVLDNGKSGKYFAKICPKLNIQISKKDLGDAKLYSVYVDDDGIAYFQALKVMGGNYVIAAGQHAILKANSDATVEFEIGYGGGSVMDDKIFSFDEDVQIADFQANARDTDGDLFSDVDPYKYSNNEDVVFTPGSDYVYALTNSKKSNGFGFTYYKGTTLKAGAFFIVSRLAPSKAGRIETVWLDEDGNVEGEATAIKKIQSKTEDGAIYNLQGVRVNAAKKGIYIQNGKKYIMK